MQAMKDYVHLPFKVALKEFSSTLYDLLFRKSTTFVFAVLITDVSTMVVGTASSTITLPLLCNTLIHTVMYSAFIYTLYVSSFIHAATLTTHMYNTYVECNIINK